jgi:hypothetical protein
VRNGRRTRLAIAMALLFLLIAFLVGLEFLTRGASGFPDSQHGSSELMISNGNDHGKTSGPPEGVAGASTHAFTHDFDGVDSLGASGSRDGYSKIVGDQPGSKTTGAGTGSGNPAGVGDFGLAGGPVTSGGGGSSNSHGPGSGDPKAGAAPFVSVGQPSPGGGSGGPFSGGGGTGGSGGPGGSGSPGGPRGSSGSGGSSGTGGFGGPGGGIHETALLFTGMDLGGGPSYTGPNPTSVATVPEPPTIILIIAGVGLVWGAMKIRRA